MGFSFGLHVQQDYDLPAMMASPDMQQIYGTVLEVWLAASVQQQGSAVKCLLCVLRHSSGVRPTPYARRPHIA